MSAEHIRGEQWMCSSRAYLHEHIDGSRMSMDEDIKQVRKVQSMCRACLSVEHLSMNYGAFERDEQRWGA